MKKNIVYYTLYFSIIIQFITFLIGLDGYRYKLKPMDESLKDILTIENVVQLVEGLVYIWILYYSLNFDDMINKRYLDWFITTPLMLLSTILFMKYNTEKEKNNSINSKQFFYEYLKDILYIGLLNALMLLFGFLGEKKIINKNLSIIIGFIFFFLTFKYIYDKFFFNNEKNKKLFYFVFIIWSLYGVAAFFPDIQKNSCYNILDLISKNFYGLLIYYKIRQLSIN